MSTRCITCNNLTQNPKFCSRSCAAKTNNKLNPKRKPEGVCKLCKIQILSNRSYCKNCYKENFSSKDLTLEEAIYTTHHRSSAYALIRTRARQKIKSKNITKCYNCNYNKHIEVCHVKPICSFDLNTKISIINSDENLICLCPNCHWEFDNKLLSLVNRQLKIS